ncbi:MAG: DUF1634 domain-containing protein [Chloroflexota bacterium]
MSLEASIARLLRLGVYLSMTLLAAGVIALLAAGISPLAGAPPLDPAAFAADLVDLRPDNLLWLGLLVLVATPSVRVLAALVGYLRSNEPRMVAVSLLILVVIAASIALALIVEP